MPDQDANPGAGTPRPSAGRLYDAGEVDAYIAGLHATLADLRAEVLSLRSQLAELPVRSHAQDGAEQLLGKTLARAQQYAAEVKAETDQDRERALSATRHQTEELFKLARHEAQQIIADARLEAKRILADAHEEGGALVAVAKASQVRALELEDQEISDQIEASHRRLIESFSALLATNGHHSKTDQRSEVGDESGRPGEEEASEDSRGPGFTPGRIVNFRPDESVIEGEALQPDGESAEPDPRSADAGGPDHAEQSGEDLVHTHFTSSSSPGRSSNGHFPDDNDHRSRIGAVGDTYLEDLRRALGVDNDAEDWPRAVWDDPSPLDAPPALDRLATMPAPDPATLVDPADVAPWPDRHGDRPGEVEEPGRRRWLVRRQP